MRISKVKRDKISEQILSYLFSLSPKSIFTSNIAQEVARDEEFIKSLLLSLQQKKLVLVVKKNSKGVDYHRRLRWRLSPEVFEIYKKKQM